MRLARLLGAAAVLLALAPAAQAQAVLHTARVVVPEAEVRSGPGEGANLYPTNRLRAGDLVEVVKEVDKEWLGIKPPAGSFSWVNARFLKRDTAPAWVVNADEAPVLYGSSVWHSKPTVESTRIKRGTLVVSIGDLKEADDGMWLPIESPPGEVRYIRRSAVAQQAAPPTTLASAPSGTSGAPPASGGFVPQHTPSAPPPAPASAAPAGADPDWLAAQKAENEGRIDEAIRIYTQLGQKVVNTNHDLAMQCFNKVQWLRGNYRSSVPVGYQPGRPTEARYAGTDTRLYPVAAGSQPPTATLASPCCCAQPNQSTCRGYLRRSGRSVNCCYTYVLESPQGLPLMYVTAQPGVNLESYVGRNVEVTGPAVWRGDVRCNYMTASRVAPLP
ncbi:MAG TPA: SH3 domain-containing protein [Gemmataceae bacterium]|nr:SH3 domain-containing protein [Gemmataceae bacterium]